MAKQNRNIIFTTIAIEAETDKLIEKLCKRYSLKKGEIQNWLSYIWIKPISTLRMRLNR